MITAVDTNVLAAFWDRDDAIDKGVGPFLLEQADRFKRNGKVSTRFIVMTSFFSVQKTLTDLPAGNKMRAIHDM